MPSTMLSDLHSDLQPLIAKLCGRINAGECGADVTGKITCGLRTATEQAGLYAMGRTVRGALCRREGCHDCFPGGMGHTVTKAMPGHGYHEYGRAVDVMLYRARAPIFALEDRPGHLDPAWEAYGRIADDLGLCWGGHWNQKDGPHVELHPSGLGCRDAWMLAERREIA